MRLILSNKTTNGYSKDLTFVIFLGVKGNEEGKRRRSSWFIFGLPLNKNVDGNLGKQSLFFPMRG